MASVVSVDRQDVEAVLDGRSLTRIQALQIAMAAGLVIAAVVFGFLYRLQHQEGVALIQGWPYLMPLITLIHIGVAALTWRRDRGMQERLLHGEALDPAAIAALGWKSALKKTPAEACILAAEAVTALRLGAYAGLALFGLGVLWVGVVTSDLLQLPFYWINAAGYLYWWVLFFQSFLTRARVLDLFSRHLAAEDGTAPVITDQS